MVFYSFICVLSTIEHEICLICIWVLVKLVFVLKIHKKVQTVMVNNSTNVKNNNHPSPQIIEHKMSIAYRDRHNYMVGVKLINGFHTPHHDNGISNGNTDINKRLKSCT
jgi:hypothetical protein